MSDSGEHKSLKNIKDSMYYWLGKSKPFYINGEYKLKLLFIDKINHSAKIEITNLKTKQKHTQDIEVTDEV
jgi:hypothetical protein